MANTTKERAVTRVLRTLGPHIDVTSSRFGTLGGAGYELEVWRRLGVPLGNCWLIERDQHRARRLIARARAAHHFVGRLRDFPAVFRSAHPGGMLDVFHWDLCETVEPNARELRYVFPVIAGSTSRCLLVTCADQRRNRSLDEADVIDAWWTWLLGSVDAFREFRTRLEAQGAAAQRRGFTMAEAANAATRELSVYLHLLLVMSDFRYEGEAVAHGRSLGLAALDRTRSTAGRGKPLDIGAAFASGHEPAVTFLPDELVRFVYFSRADTAIRPGFRMRTIGMHLARLDQPISVREAAQRLAELVMATSLKMVVPGSGGKMRTVSVPPARRGRPTMEKEEMMTGTTDSGAALTASLNENHFERLSAETDAFATQLAQRLHALGLPTEAVVALARQAVDPLRKLVEIDGGLCAQEEATRRTARMRELLGVGNNGGASLPFPSVPLPPDPEAPASEATEGSSVGMSDERKDALRLRLLRARKEGDARYQAEKKKVCQETGLVPKVVASLLATTSGKFAPNFIKRVCSAIPKKGDARRALALEFQSLGYGKSSREKKVLAPFLR
ncbi:MAG: hypothetical protein Q7S02_02525 [bacterium]|nr:hypothetical protein [bacterium]